MKIYFFGGGDDADDDDNCVWVAGVDVDDNLFLVDVVMMILFGDDTLFRR